MTYHLPHRRLPQTSPTESQPPVGPASDLGEIQRNSDPAQGPGERLWAILAVMTARRRGCSASEKEQSKLSAQFGGRHSMRRREFVALPGGATASVKFEFVINLKTAKALGLRHCSRAPTRS